MGRPGSLGETTERVSHSQAGVKTTNCVRSAFGLLSVVVSPWNEEWVSHCSLTEQNFKKPNMP